MQYLTADDGQRRTVRAMRGRFAAFDFGTIREFLRNAYPGAAIASPLESMPAGGRSVVVYVSPRRDGVGRMRYGFQLWGIAPTEERDDGKDGTTAAG